jgi:hypothetical protein
LPLDKLDSRQPDDMGWAGLADVLGAALTAHLNLLANPCRLDALNGLQRPQPINSPHSTR